VKPETIRKIDLWVGKPACFKLTCLRRCLEMFSCRAKPLPPIKKILFIKLIEQGATVLAHTAIRRAVEMVGRANVFFLVFEENSAILEIMDMVPRENILIIRNKGFITFFGNLVRELGTIRRREIDAVVDMEFFARASAVIAFLTGAKRRVGLHRFTSELPYRGDLMTHRIQHNPYLHTAIAYSLMVEALDMPPGEIPLPKKAVLAPPEKPPAFLPHSEEVKIFNDVLLREGLDVKKGGPVIILNPNASDMLPLRKWPLENFFLLGTEILREYPAARLVITGAAAEKEAAANLSLRWASPRVINLAGKTTLRELLILYTLADILVTNDSGPGHFASLTDIRSIVLYGPETPKLFGALGNNSHAIYAKLACSPCVNAFNHRFSPCTNNLCLQSISPEAVFEKIKGLLTVAPQSQDF
jgi:ADP-heptose:LPS heptosyltransferase